MQTLKKVMKKENKIDTPSTVTTALRSIAAAIEEESGKDLEVLDSDSDSEDYGGLPEIHERVINHLHQHLNPALASQKLSLPKAELSTSLGTSVSLDSTAGGITRRIKEVLEARALDKKD
eukprot:Protomagalhaensia_wolfi_Nauph_80__2961@NODE_3038_length_911_cov_501_655963_g2322_i1_p1_GENE_NODE_3038_length_911_cov_501_655963_g2322_i1NODE_3038_length_911_cov_501_655963_g2322_i1_p1_ORF_typecomplete_len120_score40_15Groundlike/PF04155_18/0_049Groundlike/PF04155_18/6e03_NODE_3038_length_911_cov_501_655963_g2322_i1157516